MDCLTSDSVVGLMATSFKRAYATGLLHPESLPLQQATADLHFHRRLKHRSISVSVGSLCPGSYNVLFKPSKHFWQVWSLILNVISPLLPSCWGFSALGRGVSLHKHWQTLFSWAPKSLQMVTTAMKLKDACSLASKSYGQPRQHIKKQRHYFANKGLSRQSYCFSSSHVCMWELDYKESWALKNWCIWTVVLEKTLESPLDCKEIQPVHPKGN